MEKQSTRTGTSLLGLLTVLFIGLKLTNFISWSWIWVLAPIWGPFAMTIPVALFALFLAYRNNRKKHKE